MRYEMTTSSGEVAIVSKSWKAAQTVTGLTEKQKKHHDALIAAELFKLRTAYPTQARNFTQEEVAATNALWSEVFACVDLATIHEAVVRFIVTYRKGFFPSPGQIVGFIEQIMTEREADEIMNLMPGGLYLHSPESQIGGANSGRS